MNVSALRCIIALAYSRNIMRDKLPLVKLTKTNVDIFDLLKFRDKMLFVFEHLCL